MSGQPVPLPVDFVVLGVPVSHQTRNRQRLRGWRAKVSAEATATMGSATPTLENVELTIVYYHRGDDFPDVDNIIKPIQDALCGTVISDDSQVQDVRSARRSLDGAFRVNGMSRALADGFVSSSDFVHVRVSGAPAQEDLL
jgi:crossover junction endodeoxyribonuclease RusA